MRRAGVTLVELLVALAVATVVLAGGYQLLGLGGRATDRSVQGEAAEVASRALVQLAQHLRFARAVASPSPEALELTTRDDEAWTVALEGGDLVLGEAHGARREVLASGLEAIEFTLVDEPPWLEVAVTVGRGEGRARYRTGYFLRGRLRKGAPP